MNIQYISELAGTYFFAISGVLATDEDDRNWFAATFMGFITAIGGGSLRDVLLGTYPLVWIGDINFLYAILLGVLSSLAFFNVVVKLRRTMLLFDMAGIALFTIVGVEKSLSLGVRPEIAAMMGVFTAVMGGVIRDTLAQKKAIIFRKEVYATACLAGAILYLILEYYSTPRVINFFSSCGLIVMIRIIVIRFKIELPSFKHHKQV
jgi:uncharacterized membrane protein YeiH